MHPYARYPRQQTPPTSQRVVYPGRNSFEVTVGSNALESRYPGQRHDIRTNLLKTPSPQKQSSKRRRQIRTRPASDGHHAVPSRPTTLDMIPEDTEMRLDLGENDLMPGIFTERDTEIEVDAGMEGTGMEEWEESFATYVEMVDSGCAKFIRISRYVYIVQGWNLQDLEPTKHFYHMEARNVGNKLWLTCLCPDGEKEKSCVHQLFYLEFRDERFRRDEDLWFSEGKTVMFWRQMTSNDGNVWLTRFSVQSYGGALKGRAVVSYEGFDNGEGTWHCSKDRSRCQHITAASAYLKKVLNIRDDDWVTQELEDEERPYAVDDVPGGREGETAVSFLPIMPPKWAMLPSDKIHYTRADPTGILPSVFCLESEKSTAACSTRPKFNQALPKKDRRCTVYGLTGTSSHDLEIQLCPTCPPRRHCYIGPDPREWGVFNYNNSVLFTHELLDEYTNRYSSSETPFAAFTQAMARVYDSRGCKFVGEDLFREAWFAYVNIQDWANDLQCTKCGDMPENVIWDGVTLAFSKKFVKNSLRPPTFTDNSSTVRRRRYSTKPQWLPAMPKQRSIRSRIRQWLSESGNGLRAKESEWSGEEWNGEEEIVKEGRQAPKGVDLAELVVDLEKEAPELGKLFRKVLYSGDKTGPAMNKALRRRYIGLFEQSGKKLAAEESTIQMVNEAALELLQAFVTSPTDENASTLVDIPALMMVLEGERHVTGRFSPELLAVCQWMVGRASVVLNALKQGNLAPVPVNDAVSEEDWREAVVTDYLVFETAPAIPT
ncbi:hypothetical protein VNI00_018153 [Paramarasmius palmivorus]|uniref:HMG domain-containing protein n=1 Tax=Paramarasmius palmivorus TaxID=297713 RepID=A0AAW0B1J3_9AGAR